MILSRQIIPEDLNPHCDLDLEDSNPKLSPNTPAPDVPLYQVWLQKIQNFRIYIYFFKDLSPHCYPNVSYDTPGHDDTPTDQVSSRKVKWFRRYQLDKYSPRTSTLPVTLTSNPKAHDDLLCRLLFGLQSRAVTRHLSQFWLSRGRFLLFAKISSGNPAE